MPGVVNYYGQTLLLVFDHFLWHQCLSVCEVIIYSTCILMCSDQDKFLSIVTPKYLAQVTSHIG